jgi:hypothetical protein
LSTYGASIVYCMVLNFYKTIKYSHDDSGLNVLGWKLKTARLFNASVLNT